MKQVKRNAVIDNHHDIISMMMLDYQYFLFTDNSGKIVYLPQTKSSHSPIFAEMKLREQLSLKGFKHEKEISVVEDIIKTADKNPIRLTLNSRVHLQGKLLEDYKIKIASFSPQPHTFENPYYAIFFIGETQQDVQQLSCQETVNMMSFFSINAAVACKTDLDNHFHFSEVFINNYGKKPHFRSYIHPEDLSKFEKLLDGNSDLKSQTTCILRLLHNDGNYHYAFMRLNYIHRNVGTKLILFFADINDALQTHLKQDFQHFYFSDTDSNILLESKDVLSKNTYNDLIPVNHIIELAFKKQDYQNITQSINTCMNKGAASCRITLKQKEDKPSEIFLLKQHRINDIDGNPLGYISILKPEVNNENSIFKAIFDNLTDAIVLTEPSGLITYLNTSAKMLLNQLDAVKDKEAFTDVLMHQDLDTLLDALANGHYHFKASQKLALKQNNDSTTYLYCETKILKPNNSSPLLFFTLRDITLAERKKEKEQKELKLLQEAYQHVLEKNAIEAENEQKVNSDYENLLLEKGLLNTFFESYNNATFIVDKFFNIKFHNKKANQLIMSFNGVKIEKNTPLNEYHLPCSYNRFLNFAEEALKGKSLKMLSYSKMHNHETSRTFEINFIPLLGEFETDWDYLACSFIDVSEKQERQMQLTMYEDIVKKANEGIIVTKATPLHSPGPEIIYVNSAMEKMTGYTAIELIGNNPRILQGPKTDRAALNRIKQAIIKGRAVKEELVNYTKKGKPYWVEVSITPIIDSLGNVTCFFAHQKDISQRKEDEIERLTMIRHLLTQNEELDQFAFITSHNLRAPVARLLGLSDLIGFELDEGRLPIELFKHVVSSAKLLDEIIKDLNYILAFKKKIGEKQETIYFEDKLKQIKINLKKYIEDSNANIIFDFEHCPSVFSLRSYVTNMLEHLVHNAIKYATPGVTPEIHVCSFYKDGAPCLQVRDNGIGFPFEVSDIHFKLYKRFHPEIPGKGLGLFLVKSHIEMLRGKLEVESIENEGSRFTIVFPPQNEQPL